MPWSWLSQISDPVAIAQHTHVCPALAHCFLTGPHTLTASFCHSPSAKLHRCSSCPGFLPSRNSAAASPQNHGAVKASVPKRFGLSRCFHPQLLQLNAERSSGFLIHQLAPRRLSGSRGLPSLASRHPSRWPSAHDFQNLQHRPLKPCSRFSVTQAPRPSRRSSLL